MHEEVLSENQRQLLGLVHKFSDRFSLVGGTAIALQIGHRRSIDFDLLTIEILNHDRVRKTIRENHHIEGIIVNEPEELTLVVNTVKLTFFQYPFPIDATIRLRDVITMPDITTLASMKAFALGRRAKWKDYVDLYFISRQTSFLDIVEKTHQLFGDEFNEKLFREQLAYFADIDYSEEIDYMPGFEMADDKIQSALKEISLQK